MSIYSIWTIFFIGIVHKYITTLLNENAYNNILKLVIIFPDYAFRTSRGTFSILSQKGHFRRIAHIHNVSEYLVLSAKVGYGPPLFAIKQEETSSSAFRRVSFLYGFSMCYTMIIYIGTNKVKAISQIDNEARKCQVLSSLHCISL